MRNEEALLPPPPPTLVRVSGVRRRSQYYNVCVLLTALFVLITGVFGGIYLYKHLAQRVSVLISHYDGIIRRDTKLRRKKRDPFRIGVNSHLDFGPGYHWEFLRVSECDVITLCRDSAAGVACATTSTRTMYRRPRRITRATTGAVATTEEPGSFRNWYVT